MESCKVNEIVLDTGCHLTGHKCGVNMVFRTISEERNDSLALWYCVQRCSCEREEFVAKTFHCERAKIQLKSDMVTNEYLQVILYQLY